MIKFAKFLILFILTTSSCLVKCEGDQTLANKIIAQLNTFKSHFTGLMESFESYTIKLHSFFKDQLNLSNPIDILIFIAMGFLIYFIKSSLTSKNRFVYNQADQPDYSGLLNTKLKEITSLLKADKSHHKEETHKLDNSNSAPRQFLDKMQEQFENINSSLRNVEKELQLGSTNLNEYLPIITTSQENILSSLQKEITEDGEF